MSQNSILEKALLQVEQLEEAVKQNAKGILESTMKQELKDLLKESEEVDDKPKNKSQDDVSDKSEDDEDNKIKKDSEDEDDFDTESDEDVDVDSEHNFDSFNDDDDDSDDDDDDSDDEGSNVLDMTNSSDEEVLKVFKSMKPEDGIVVKKDGNNVNLDMDDNEYIIQLDGDDQSNDMDMSEDDDISNSNIAVGSDVTNDKGVSGKVTKVDGDYVTVSVDGDDQIFNINDLQLSNDNSDNNNDSDDFGDDSETIYEIELDSDDNDEDEYHWFGDDEEEDGKKTPPSDTKEAARTFGNQVRKPANHGTKFKAGRHDMNEEVEKLKKQNAEYKKAFVVLKEKLNGIAVFNANLAYSTRLFTEHSTTKNEKLNILKRFDIVEGLRESEKLFNTIKSELESKKPVVNESMVDKINNKSNKVSSTTEMLSESKAYENVQFSRIKELMKFK